MQEWYVHNGGATTGPFSTQQVKDLIANNKIGPQATFCLTGTTTWRPLGDVTEFAPAKPTELPIAAKRCGECRCPIARAMKKVIVLAILAAVAYFVWIKLGHPGVRAF
jgi:hypothetical protein